MGEQSGVDLKHGRPRLTSLAAGLQQDAKLKHLDPSGAERETRKQPSRHPLRIDRTQDYRKRRMTLAYLVTV